MYSNQKVYDDFIKSFSNSEHILRDLCKNKKNRTTKENEVKIEQLEKN